MTSWVPWYNPVVIRVSITQVTALIILYWIIFASLVLLLHFSGMCLLTVDFSVHISSIHLVILNYVLYIIYCRYLYLHFIVFLLLWSVQFFILLSILHFVSYKILLKFSNSNVLVLLINFLCIISSFICSHFCWKIILSICITEVYVIHSFLPHLKDIFLFLLPSSDLSLYKLLVLTLLFLFIPFSL